VLGRGYALLADAATDAPVTRTAETAAGRAITVRLIDGALAARVEHVSPNGSQTGGPPS
jgi:exonuclease VII large subunit